MSVRPWLFSSCPVLKKEGAEMQMRFEELFVFSPGEKLARHVAFTSGINVVTSCQADGTNRGKSVVLRCLYHALGAETYLEDKFDIDNKVVILRFAVDDVGYYILRSDRFYKVFDQDKRLLFRATHAHELSERLSEITHFAVRLHSKNDNRYEITPPAYNYLPYFIDQDHYEGSRFCSFDCLMQYPKFKSGVLDYHLGIASERYFELVGREQNLKDKITEWEDKGKVLDELLSSVLKKLSRNVCLDNEPALRAELERRQREYACVSEGMAAVRSELVRLRNDQHDFKTVQDELIEFKRQNDKSIAKLKGHRCPECDAELQDTISLRGRRYNLAENVELLKRDVQAEICKIEDEIADREDKYRALARKLGEFDAAISEKVGAIDDIVRFRGLNAVYSDGVVEAEQVRQHCDTAREQMAEIHKEIVKVRKKRTEITDVYCTLLMEAKTQFGLDEIRPEDFKSLEKNFSASGSDRCIATVIWYLAILRLRNQFNPDAIRFPIVFDSPNNVENDDAKTDRYLRYILANANLSGQFIMSGIGYDTEKFRSLTTSPVNTIVLDNEPYALLCRKDYELHSGLMESLLDVT